MTHVHETHTGYDDGAAVGFASGMMLAIAAIVLAIVIAAAVLLAVRPWNDSSNNTTPNLPVPQGGNSNPSDGGSTGQ